MNAIKHYVSPSMNAREMRNAKERARLRPVPKASASEPKARKRSPRPDDVARWVKAIRFLAEGTEGYGGGALADAQKAAANARRKLAGYGLDETGKPLSP